VEADMRRESLPIRIETAPASDGWGFVGCVMVGAREAYRTLQAFRTPTEALAATEEIVAGLLGSLLAGQEWRHLRDDVGHVLRREDLNLGLSALRVDRSLAAGESDGTENS
jgi:hypothetical protein